MSIHFRAGIDIGNIGAERAMKEAVMACIDLEALSDNAPAVDLYLRDGFTMPARVENLLAIDGVSHDISVMTRKLISH